MDALFLRQHFYPRVSYIRVSCMKTVEWSQCTSSNPSLIVVLPLAAETKQVISILSNDICLISVCV